MRPARYLLVPAAALALGVLPATAAEDDGHDVRGEVADVAAATPDVVIEGSGWGHGVGMSQEGAYAMAQAGHDVDDIFEHYFTDAHRAAAADLGAAVDDVPVRVGLASSTPDVRVEEAVVSLGEGTDEVRWQSCGDEGCRNGAVQDTGTWRAVADDDGLRVEEEADGQWEEVFTTEDRKLRVGEGADDPLEVRGVDGDGGEVAPRVVGRGTHEIHDVTDQGDADGRLSTVQVVPDLEQYLYGLAEVSASWPAEALRAQAVLGRTYAAARIGGGADGLCRCDLRAGQGDQVYRGWSKEHETVGGEPASGPWLDAVDDTAGEVLAHDGEMVAYPVYSASHGGASENIEDSWAYAAHQPYLRHVDDEWSLHEGNALRSWTANVEHDLIVGAVSAALADEVEAVELLDVRATTDGATPREILVAGRDEDGELVEGVLGDEAGAIAGNAVRDALSGRDLDVVDANGSSADQLSGLPSAQFDLIGFAPFTDDLGRVHEYAAAWAAEAGITEGVGDDRFEPTGEVTRRQMAAFLHRTFDIPEPEDHEPFEDAGHGEPQREAIAALAEAGVAAGYDDGTFRPGERITRAQMATFLARAIGLADVPADDRFRDVDEQPHAGAIHAVADAEVALGYDDDTFRPTLEVSREQMASFLRRAVAEAS
jgi:peptidoglycan hydrolase-like amidase